MNSKQFDPQLIGSVLHSFDLLGSQMLSGAQDVSHCGASSLTRASMFCSIAAVKESSYLFPLFERLCSLFADASSLLETGQLSPTSRGATAMNTAMHELFDLVLEDETEQEQDGDANLIKMIVALAVYSLRAMSRDECLTLLKGSLQFSVEAVKFNLGESDSDEALDEAFVSYARFVDTTYRSVARRAELGELVEDDQGCLSVRNMESASAAKVLQGTNRILLQPSQPKTNGKGYASVVLLGSIGAIVILAVAAMRAADRSFDSLKSTHETTQPQSLLPSSDPRRLRDEAVRGYTRENGTSVAPYYRTPADGTDRNNHTTKPNINPHTGKPGTFKSSEN